MVPLGNPLAFERLLYIARHGDDPNLLPCRSQLFCDLRPAKPRKHDIGQQQLDATSVRRAELQRLFTVGRLQNHLARGLEDLPHQPRRDS